ncbi:restriction endonuclease subunit S [[Pasteurella] aerogenes]
MSSWKEYKLGELLEITSSKRIMRSEYIERGIPFYRSKEIIELHNNNDVSTEIFISDDTFNKIKNKFGVPREGDLLLTSVGTLGIPYLVKDTDCFYFKDGKLTWFRNFDSKICSEYLYYWFLSSIGKQKIRDITIGSTQQALTIVSLKSLTIKLPDLETQQYIVNILNSISGKIKNNIKINQTLEQIAQTIFKSWFIDFDPVHAKANALANGQTLEQATQAAMAVISGKNTQELHRLQTANPEQYQQLWEIAEAFPSGFDEEGVPWGWESKKVGEVVETVGGATPSTKNEDFWLDGDISWTTPKDLSSLKSKVLLKTERKITQQGLRKISSGLLDIDTVLMSSRAPVGYLALVKTPVAINQGYIAIKKQDLLNPYYMLFWCVFNMEEIKNRSSGTTFAEISKSSFREIPIIVPSRRIVDYFRDKVSSLYDLITKNEQEVNLLGNIRDELLPKLLSGDISNE